MGRLEQRTATALSRSTGPSCPSTGLPHHQPLPSQPAAGRDGAELCPCTGLASPSLPLGQDRLLLTSQGDAPQGCSCTWGTVFARTGLLCRSQAERGAPGCRAGPAQPCRRRLHHCRAELYLPVLQSFLRRCSKCSRISTQLPQEGVGRAARATALPLAAAPWAGAGAWGPAAAGLQGLLLEELTAFPTLFKTLTLELKWKQHLNS